MAFQVWGLVSLILFYLVIFLAGIYASRRIKKTSQIGASEDVMLAGRDLGLIVGMFSMTATWVNGGYLNGAAESVFSQGVLWCQAPIGYSIALIVAGRFFATKMRETSYVTMLDPFHAKYGKHFTCLLYIPSLLGDILSNAAILSALGATVAKIIDLDVKVSIITSGVIAIIYTLAGGMYSVTYTDVVELVCIFFGMWLCVPFCATHKAVGSLAKTNVNYWGVLPTKEIASYVDGYLLLILGGVPWQTYFQRVLASRTAKIGKIVSYVAGVWCILLAIPSMIIGALATVTDWSKTNYGHKPEEAREVSMILPICLLNLTPTGVAYIGLGAVAAAVMSSSDATILSSSSQFARIVYRNVFRPRASEREMLWVMRGAMVVSGVLATTISLTIDTVYGLWYLSGDLVYAILFPQLTCLVYLDKHCNVWGASAGFVLAWILRFIFGESLVGIPAAVRLPWYDEATGDQLFPYKTVIVIINFIVIIGVSKLAVRFCPQFVPAYIDIWKAPDAPQQIALPDVSAVPNGIPLDVIGGQENKAFEVVS